MHNHFIEDFIYPKLFLIFKSFNDKHMFYLLTIILISFNGKWCIKV